MNKKEKNLWDKTADFHGHVCPGLAIGFRAAITAMDLLEKEDFEDDENIVCISETDACGIDAIQVVLSATMGSGALRIVYKGKNAFSFYNRKKNKSLRIVFKGTDKNLSREERMDAILNSPFDDFFEIKETHMPFPPRASIFNSIKCSMCGENTAENAVIDINGKYFCIDCKEISK